MKAEEERHSTRDYENLRQVEVSNVEKKLSSNRIRMRVGLKKPQFEENWADERRRG